MRIDRFLSLGISRIAGNRRLSNDRRIPILMYHGVSSSTESGVHPYFQVTTTLPSFENQIAWLAEKGFKGGTLQSLLTENRRQKKVIVTFDDGFEDFYSTAWPVLHRFGFTATVFLPADYIGNERNGLVPGKSHLSWEQVRELADAGIEFGSHTLSHPILYDCSRQRIRDEIVNSKHCIERHLGAPVASFSYPFAFPIENSEFVEFVRKTTIEAGYRLMVSTLVGRNSGPDFRDRFLTRLPINDADDIALFAAKIRGAYDWIGVMQFAAKKVRVLLGCKRARKRF